MEGKEVRFGIANTALFATVTTDASCGAINGWHDSFYTNRRSVPLANIQLSEVVLAASVGCSCTSSCLSSSRG
jgi:K+-transporting ATPase ATPase A chain